MSNLLLIGKVLQALQIASRQDNDYLRLHCPLQHTKTPSRPSATLHLKSGGFHCFACKHSSPNLQHLLGELLFQQQYITKEPFDKTLKAKALLETLSPPDLPTILNP